ncbi:hypothetical protein AUJ66_00595 [Candidatus Desantisbacteria bacterium CG1_02_38_46]|uniref:HTH lacI-type domain-containing protein n=1 Tax=Candidatus Desantisbacteria bacterium CG1_02_38_46 TaxID=1817893 RepID=A0A1J4SH25_9BACT|nr:MAG: hypothetical protein AUJ66_00595 [Candidatus Desantisbacteria bacterium CG1_02_38_46]
MYTLRDVAQKAGVSLTTASLVFNNKETQIRISKKTKERILSVIKELNYHPNIPARMMAKGRTSLIGLVMLNIHSSFYPEIIEGIQSKMDKQDYSTILYNTKGNFQLERKYLEVLDYKQVDGIILNPTHYASRNIEIVSKKRPLVSICFSLSSHRKIPSVVVDNFKGGYIATKYLFSLGHKRIGYIGSLEPTSLDFFQRHRGYCTAINKESLKDYSFPLNEFGNNIEEQRLNFAKYYLNSSQKITALFAQHDRSAIYIMNALQEKGIKVPEDVSIIGFDNLDICNFTNPSLTSINQPKFEIGEKAGELLLKMIDGEKVKSIILEPTIIERGSCLSPKN